ncbi:MAG: YjbH domain-containing protein [Bacteroides sp.]|nr:YjbH domain-containing protein [Bacteroides sp.]
MLLLLAMCAMQMNAQALRGTTGLLHAPTADMEKDKTFKFGGNVLDLTPLRFGEFDVEYTFNYYINITIFPWLEVGYTCTLNYANEGSTYFPQTVWGKYSNQDRSFYGRLRVWKEGWWKDWTPQVVIGVDDPGTHENAGGGSITTRDSNGGNAHFMRYYLAATKHFDFVGIGNLGAHLSYLKDMPDGYPEAEGIALGANFRFKLPESSFWNKAINGLNLMAEYDARTVNVGFNYSFWKDRINVITELNDGKYWSGGLYFRVHLK